MNHRCHIVLTSSLACMYVCAIRKSGWGMYAVCMYVYICRHTDLKQVLFSFCSLNVLNLQWAYSSILESPCPRWRCGTLNIKSWLWSRCLKHTGIPTLNVYAHVCMCVYIYFKNLTFCIDNLLWYSTTTLY